MKRVVGVLTVVLVGVLAGIFEGVLGCAILLRVM